MKEYVEAKVQYNKLLFSGELYSLLPNMTGVWKKDKEEFVKYYLLNKKAIENASK